jgi:transporter family protein
MVQNSRWLLHALLAALFAGITAPLAKVGMAGVPSNIATLVRTAVVLAFIGGIVIVQKQLVVIPQLPTKTWIFLVLSGLATGISWLFYFSAIKDGPLSVVAPIDKLSFVLAILIGIIAFGERPNRLTIIGIICIVAGVTLCIPSVQSRLQSSTENR